ncbi:MAG: hypothetical protein AB1779_02715 [Candidatus Thermoplasmatota archaeon]
MESMEDRLREAYKTLDTNLDTLEMFERYYVFREEKKLEEVIEKTKLKKNAKFLIVGQGKCGKTTELLRIGYELKENHIPIYISSNFPSVNSIIFSIGLEIKNLTSSDIRPYIEFYNINIENDVYKTAKEGLKNWWLTDALKDIKTSSALKLVNGLLEELRVKRMEPLVLIDNIEKMKSENAFYLLSELVPTINAKVFATAPIEAIYGDEWREMKNFIDELIFYKPLRKEEYILLKDIFEKRGFADIIEEKALKIAIESSGGLVGLCFSFIKDSSIKALSQGIEKIDGTIINEVIEEKRTLWKNSLTENEKKKIKNIEKMEQDTTFFSLLRNLYILDYFREYEIHPLVR